MYPVHVYSFNNNDERDDSYIASHSYGILEVWFGRIACLEMVPNWTIQLSSHLCSWARQKMRMAMRSEGDEDEHGEGNWAEDFNGGFLLNRFRGFLFLFCFLLAVNYVFFSFVTITNIYYYQQLNRFFYLKKTVWYC